MSSWVKEVEASEVKDGQQYFVARRRLEYAPGMFSEWRFQGTDSKHRTVFIKKPGIATIFTGGPKLREQLVRMVTLIAVEVPADAHKRWRARVFRTG